MLFASRSFKPILSAVPPPVREWLEKKIQFRLCESNKFITFGKMKSSELIRLLKKDGWFVIRQTGSHMIMEHPVKKGQIVCPNHGSHEVGKGLEMKIKRDAGIK